MRVKPLLFASVSGALLLSACTTDTTPQSRTETAGTPTPSETRITREQASQNELMVGMASPALMAPPPPPPPPSPIPVPMVDADVDRDRYEDIEINPIKVTAEEPVSTFSIDVDTAAYANIRSMLNDGYLPPKDAVRIEEMVNYFDYDYAPPETESVPFATHVNVTPSPWADGKKLVHIGIKGFDMDRSQQPPLNLTLLVDVSGSMNAQNKLPLAIKALKMLVNNLDENDHVSIVVYAGAAGAVLEPTNGSEKGKIIAALESLSAGGSTAGGEGIRLAYSLAEQNFQKDAVNRVMLLTDGDFNVGVTSDERLEDLVSRKRESGVYLSVLGFGRGNYNDAMMQKIAQSGNGMASYIDTLNEARKVLSDDLAGSMFTIANDVKIQVEFNPAKVQEYRLIGYETRMLDREDFNNDQVDAGDIGAGHTVTALYEITPVGSDANLVDPNRYGNTSAISNDILSSEYGYLKLRYKLPGEDTSKLIEKPIDYTSEIDDFSNASNATRFASAVAGFGQKLKGAPYLDTTFNYDAIIDLANSAKSNDPFGYRAEFVQLVRAAQIADDQETLRSDTSTSE